MQAVSASTSAGLDGREHPDPQLVAAELAVGLDVDDAVGAQDRGERGGVDRRRRSRSCRRRASASPGRRRTAWRTRQPRPIRRGATRTSRVRADAPVEPALARASTRSGRQQDQGGQRRGVVGLVPCASSRAPSAARGRPAASARRPRRAPRSARSRPGLSSASQRPPSEPKALLRGEVVGVGLADVDRQAAGARGGVDQDQRVVGARRAGRRRP